MIRDRIDVAPGALDDVSLSEFVEFFQSQGKRVRLRPDGKGWVVLYVEEGQ